MGRDRIQDIENLVRDIYIYLELDDFENFRKRMDELLSINLKNLSPEEAKVLYKKISEIEEKISKKQRYLAESIKKRTDVQKYF